MFKSMINNFRKWKTTYRVYIAFIAVFVFTYIRSDYVKSFAISQKLGVSPYFFAFQMDDGITRMLFYFGVVLLFCNAPFTDEQQIFVLSRIGRKKWFCGQILYIFCANIIYFLWMFLISVIVFLPWLGMTTKWGSVLINLAHNNSIAGVVMHEEVIMNFNPITACLITFIMNVIVGFIIGLIIFAINMVGNRVFGAATAIGIIVFSDLITILHMPKLCVTSLIHWTYPYIFLRESDSVPITYIVIMELVLIVGLIGFILAKSKKYTLDALEVL